MDNNLIFSRVATIFEDVFGIETSEVTFDTSTDTLKDWDSMRHITIVNALEENFGVSLPPEDQTKMKSVKAIVEILSARLK